MANSGASGVSGANPIFANSADEWREDYNYHEVIEYFGIEDQNPEVKPIEGKTLNVFSTNLFIPIDLFKLWSDKLFLYLTGFVKLVELFRTRTESLQTESDQWMLYIYCDNMFFEEGGFKNDVYIPRKENNENNKFIKGNYSKNQAFFKRLLQLYKDYIAIITANKGGKYSFLKLFSFNCLNVKNGKAYLGHPSTFGSFIRFLPFFDDSISRVFSINISHAITPKLVYSIEEWIKLQKELITIKGDYYFYNVDSKKMIYIIKNFLIENNKFDENEYKKREEINLRHAAGLFGFYKKKEGKIKIDVNIFMNIIKKIIQLYKKNYKFQNNKHNLIIFKYEIDEILLEYIIKLLFIDDPTNYVYLYINTSQKSLSKILGDFIDILTIKGLSKLFKKSIPNKALLKEFINNTFDRHRYIGRAFIDSIKKTEEIKSFLKDPQIFDFETLLNGFDEIKPLIVVENDEDTKFPEFFTYLDFQMKILIQALISYYTNGDLVLKVPYVIDEQLSVAKGKQSMMAAAAANNQRAANNQLAVAGGGKNKKKTKKPKRKLKTNKTKKLIKK
jgi:hypothetical protein